MSKDADDEVEREEARKMIAWCNAQIAWLRTEEGRKHLRDYMNEPNPLLQMFKVKP